MPGLPQPLVPPPKLRESTWGYWGSITPESAEMEHTKAGTDQQRN